MTLTDAGPLIALLNRKDHHHRMCWEAVSTLPRRPMVTTWPCFTEAMYMLGEAGGSTFQAALWALRAGGALALTELSSAEIERTSALMQKYSDTPMDLGDASLVAVAESRGFREVFTLDHHFAIHRTADGSALTPVPAL